MSEGRGFFYKSKRTPAHEGAQFIPGGSGYGELKFYQNFDTGAVRAQEGVYKSGHFLHEKDFSATFINSFTETTPSEG